MVFIEPTARAMARDDLADFYDFIAEDKAEFF